MRNYDVHTQLELGLAFTFRLTTLRAVSDI